jgi:hypothetical protein
MDLFLICQHIPLIKGLIVREGGDYEIEMGFMK